MSTPLATAYTTLIFSVLFRSCFEWESPGRSTIAFVLFLVVTWYFQPFFMPMFFLIYFLRSFLV